MNRMYKMVWRRFYPAHLVHPVGIAVFEI